MVSDERFLAGPAVMEDIFVPERHIFVGSFCMFLGLQTHHDFNALVFICLQVLHLETLKDDIAGLEERLCTRQGQSGFLSFPTWKDDRYCCWKIS